MHAFTKPPSLLNRSIMVWYKENIDWILLYVISLNYYDLQIKLLRTDHTKKGLKQTLQSVRS